MTINNESQSSIFFKDPEHLCIHPPDGDAHNYTVFVPGQTGALSDRNQELCAQLIERVAKVSDGAFELLSVIDLSIDKETVRFHSEVVFAPGQKYEISVEIKKNAEDAALFEELKNNHLDQIKLRLVPPVPVENPENSEPVLGPTAQSSFSFTQEGHLQVQDSSGKRHLYSVTPILQDTKLPGLSMTSAICQNLFLSMAQKIEKVGDNQFLNLAQMPKASLSIGLEEMKMHTEESTESIKCEISLNTDKDAWGENLERTFEEFLEEMGLKKTILERPLSMPKPLKIPEFKMPQFNGPKERKTLTPQVQAPQVQANLQPVSTPSNVLQQPQKSIAPSHPSHRKSTSLKQPLEFFESSSTTLSTVPKQDLSIEAQLSCKIYSFAINEQQPIPSLLRNLEQMGDEFPRALFIVDGMVSVITSPVQLNLEALQTISKQLATPLALESAQPQSILGSDEMSPVAPKGILITPEHTLLLSTTDTPNVLPDEFTRFIMELLRPKKKEALPSPKDLENHLDPIPRPLFFKEIKIAFFNPLQTLLLKYNKPAKEERPPLTESEQRELDEITQKIKNKDKKAEPIYPKDLQTKIVPYRQDKPTIYYNNGSLFVPGMGNLNLIAPLFARNYHRIKKFK